MKNISSSSGLLLTALSVSLLVASYNVHSEVGRYTKGGIPSLLYPQILLWLLAGLGMLIFFQDLRRQKAQEPFILKVVLLGIFFILYYFVFGYVGFYIPTVIICLAISYFVDTKFSIFTIIYSLIFPLGVWALFVYGLSLQVPFF